MPSEREQAFLTLVRENDARLRRICRVYAHDAESRKDLHQEMLLQLWRSLGAFRGASSAATWVYRVALNTALTYARRRGSLFHVPLDDEQLAIEHVASPLGTEDMAEADARSAQLFAAIAQLDAVDRMLVTMYLDERSYREMADVLGISESNVGVKLHRIRKALGRMLTEETV